MNTKYIWASKTFWVNVLVFIAAITGMMNYDIGLTAEKQTAIVTGIMAIVNIILRMITTTGVKVKPNDDKTQSAWWVGLFVLMLVLTGCAGSAETRTTNALAIACDAYATALDQLTPLREAGTLTEKQVSRVNSANLLVDPACLSTSTLDPATAITTVRQGIELLKLIKDGL